MDHRRPPPSVGFAACEVEHAGGMFDLARSPWRGRISEEVDAAPREAYHPPMQTILAILVVILAIGALVALVRGIIVFLRTKDEELRRDPSAGPSESSLKQNNMMWRRIQFQALAVIAAVLLLLLAHPHAG